MVEIRDGKGYEAPPGVTFMTPIPWPDPDMSAMVTITGPIPEGSLWTPEQRSRAMGFHVPDNWRDVVRFVDIGAGYVTPPIVRFDRGPLICDGWDFGGDA